MALDASFGPWAAVSEAKERNRQNMMDSIQGIGQTIGNVGQIIKDKQQKNQWQKTINEMMQNPNISPQMKAMLPVIAQRPELLGQLGPSMMKTQKSTMGGAGKRVVYQNPDGSVSLSPVEGSTPLEVSDAQAMQYTAVPKSAKSKNEALGARAEAIQRGIDARQVDELARTTGITPHQRNILQQNNMRADRALEIASRPMTWQEFNMVLTDAAAIMQGGVPHIDQLKNAAYPSWQTQFAKWQTYSTGHPTENVPPEISKRVVDMVKGIKEVDNRYLKMNAQFQQKMLGPTIRGGLGKMAPVINDMTQQMTQGGTSQASPKNSGKPGWSPMKESRYQELLRKQQSGAL